MSAFTPEGVVVIIALVANVGAHFYRAGKVDTRLASIERILNNGMSSAVVEHGEDIASIQATCKAHHGAEIQI